MKYEDIIKRARKELTDFIIYETKSIAHKLGIEPDEDGAYILESDDFKEEIKIGIVVDNSYLDIDETTWENRALSAIVVGEDEVWFSTDEDLNEEIGVGDLTTDELANIARVLEETYFDIMK
jgi:hypothetical protein